MKQGSGVEEAGLVWCGADGRGVEEVRDGGDGAEGGEGVKRGGKVGFAGAGSAGEVGAEGDNGGVGHGLRFGKAGLSLRWTVEMSCSGRDDICRMVRRVRRGLCV